MPDRRLWASAGATVALAGLIVCVELQLVQADRASAAARAGDHWIVRATKILDRRGLRGGCAVLGFQAPSIAYTQHCRAADMHDGFGARNTSADVSAANVARLAGQGLTVVVVWTAPPATPGVTWWQAGLGHGRRLYIAQWPAGRGASAAILARGQGIAGRQS
ncbi:hypothetical protein [Actinoallomurus acanthiterrae]